MHSQLPPKPTEPRPIPPQLPNKTHNPSSMPGIYMSPYMGMNPNMFNQMQMQIMMGMPNMDQMKMNPNMINMAQFQNMNVFNFGNGYNFGGMQSMGGIPFKQLPFLNPMAQVDPKNFAQQFKQMQESKQKQPVPKPSTLNNS